MAQAKCPKCGKGAKVTKLASPRISDQEESVTYNIVFTCNCMTGGNVNHMKTNNTPVKAPKDKQEF